MQNHRWRWYKVKCVNALSGLYLISTWYQQRTRKDPFAMCQCPLGLIPHFYLTLKSFSCYFISVCQCPLGLIPHFYLESTGRRNIIRQSVNALSGLYLISTHGSLSVNEKAVESVNALSGLYLISTVINELNISSFISVNALSGLYLISTVPLQKPRFYAVSRACFCRYLSEYSDNSRFSCMLTFWTYLMRCTSP